MSSNNRYMKPYLEEINNLTLYLDFISLKNLFTINEGSIRDLVPGIGQENYNQKQLVIPIDNNTGSKVVDYYFQDFFYYNFYPIYRQNRLYILNKAKSRFGIELKDIKFHHLQYVIKQEYNLPRDIRLMPSTLGYFFKHFGSKSVLDINCTSGDAFVACISMDLTYTGISNFKYYTPFTNIIEKYNYADKSSFHYFDEDKIIDININKRFYFKYDTIFGIIRRPKNNKNISKKYWINNYLKKFIHYVYDQMELHGYFFVIISKKYIKYLEFAKRYSCLDIGIGYENRNKRFIIIRKNN